MELEEGLYYLKTPAEPEPVLVHFYHNCDANMKGFGFNVHDGGGFLPLHDLTEDTEVVKVEITEVL